MALINLIIAFLIAVTTVWTKGNELFSHLGLINYGSYFICYLQKLQNLKFILILRYKNAKSKIKVLKP